MDTLIVQTFVSEPTQNLVTKVNLRYESHVEGLIEIDVDTVSASLDVNMFELFLLLIFAITFVMNMILFFAKERDNRNLYKKWKEHNVATLHQYEKDQRQKFRPAIIRDLRVYLRPFTIGIFVHVCLTIYTESLAVLALYQMLNVRK